MRLIFLVFTAIITTPSAWAQPTPSSSRQESSASTPETLNLPVNLDRIKLALEEPQPLTLSLRSLDERPTFRVLIRERQRIEELLATLNYKTTPTPAGGIYMAEMQRQWWPAVDNPLNQPYAAFNQAELLTVLIENLVGKYLVGRAVNSISRAEREAAQAAAREEVLRTIREYCAAQPNNGAGISLCSTDR